ncbi:MAG: 50S ribosomal protein L9 [Phycisphaeraceae bacterium]|nr:50S ribosomal protein L9 [Phycisphaeraceae bacterium]
MKMIELLLLETVETLGIVGDVVKVRPGYARNFLLPRGLATKPTPKAIENLAARRAEVEAELTRLKAEREALIEKLSEFELTLPRTANDQGHLYGGVSQHDIAQALSEAGFAIEDRHVRIGEQIKRLDSYEIPIVLDKDLRTQIKLWVVRDQPTTADLDAAAESAEVEEPAVEAELEQDQNA